MSLGLLTRLTVDDKFTAGDVAKNLAGEIKVHVEVAGPSWVQADRVELFANGVKIREQAIQPTPKPVKLAMDWTIAKPAHDMHLVAIASGPGIREPYWEIAFPYQPTDRVRNPRVLGATNPIWLDADADGEFTPARKYGKALVEKAGTKPENLLPALATFDETVAAQAASFCKAAGADLQSESFRQALQKAAPAVRRGFEQYLGTLTP